MDAQDFRGIQEAYIDVVMNEGVVDSPYDRAQTNRADAYGRASTNRADAYGKAQTQKKKKPKTQKEQVDIYDIILSHLLDEGYADTQEAAEAIMVNMSEDWREDIVEAETGRGPRLIDAYDKPPYSDDVKDAPKYEPIKRGPKRTGVVKK